MSLLLALLLTAPQDDLAQRVRALVREMRSDSVEAREKAARELDALGPRVAPLLRAALREERDRDARWRLEELLRSFVARPVSEGSMPRISSDGKWLAVRRFVQDPDQTDIRGNRVWRSEVWIRDQQTGRERRVAEDDYLLGWIDAETLILLTGGPMSANVGVKPPEVARLPGNMRVKNREWASGGRSVACIPDVMFYRSNPLLTPPAGADGTIYVLEGPRAPRPLALDHTVNTDSSGFLSWSPDGKRLAFHLLFFRRGDVPIRRIGVVEISSGRTVFVGEGAYVHQNWGLLGTETPGGAPGMWDGRGERLVFVTGRGGGEGEVYVATADGAEVVQLTDDGLSKWSPTLDPAGRRVAFCVAKRVGEDGSMRGYHLRVLDLLTGEAQSFRPDETGGCHNVVWSPNGSRIFYDWSGRILEARPEPPPPPPPGARVAGKPAQSRREKILEALRADNPAIVAWGAEQAGAGADEETLQALRRALAREVARQEYAPAREILETLRALRAHEAAPEVILALEFKEDWTKCLAASIAGAWKLEAAIPRLKEILANLRESRPGIFAAGALARMGERSGLEALRGYVKSRDRQVRGDAAVQLGEIPDPESVDLLIGLVSDMEVRFMSLDGDTQVGDTAELSLALLTGETFGRDPAKWKAWWETRGRKLPEVSPSNPALDKLRRLKK